MITHPHDFQNKYGLVGLAWQVNLGALHKGKYKNTSCTCFVSSVIPCPMHQDLHITSTRTNLYYMIRITVAASITSWLDLSMYSNCQSQPRFNEKQEKKH